MGLQQAPRAVAGGMSLSNGASSGPCAWPVSATRSGMYSVAPLRAGALPQHLRSGASSPQPDSSNAAAAAAKNRGAARRCTTAARLAPSGGSSPRTTASHGAASAGSTTLCRTAPTKSRGSALARARRRPPRRDMRCSVSFCQCSSCASSKRAGRAAEMLGPEMRGISARRKPALEVAGVPQPEQVIEQRRGQEAASAELLHAGAAVALGQRRAVGADQQARRGRRPAAAAPAHRAASAGAACWSGDRRRAARA